MTKKISIRILLSLLIVIALLFSLSTAQADPGASYQLTWWTVDGGGTTFDQDTNSYSLGGTAGQPDAALWSGGGYTLSGGFWAGVAAEFRIYLPLVLRSH